MGMIKEFKEFAFKGSMMDMAVGLIIGGAFGTVIKSLVDDLLMPVVGLFKGKDFSNMFVQLADKENTQVSVAAAKEAGVATLNYGLFINALIAFLITAFALFMVIKAMNKARATAEEAPAEPDAQEVLLTEIRDLLKKQA